MADGIQVAAFTGGELRLLASGETSREAVLALPLNRMLVRIVRVPQENLEDTIAFVTPLMQELSPYPDEALTVSCETVREGDRGHIVIAAALPESATDDIGEALDAKKLNVTRVDALVLGTLRGLWSVLGVEDGARRLVLVREDECLAAVVLDGDSPSAIRAISENSDLKREALLCLLEAEDFGGAKELKEIAVVGEANVEVLEGLASIRRLEVGEDVCLVGVGERSADAGALNALPASWQEMLDETRFKAKMVKHIIVAGAIWALLMGVVFGVPAVFGFMTDHQKELCKEHRRQYEAVREMRDKVELVKKYSDHARGALEVMKAVSDRLPEDITLTSWNYKREEGVKVTGEADRKDSVYTFKDSMAELAAGEGEDAEKVFGTIVFPGPSAGKAGKQKFDLDCRYEKEAEE